MNELDILLPPGVASAAMPREFGSLKVAIVHEWLTNIAGSERVVEQICCLFPQAELFVLVADRRVTDSVDFLKDRQIHTSFIQSLPMGLRRYRAYLPLMPLAIEQFDVSRFDLIISSSHAVAKGILTGPDQLHISYIHTPIRYAWDLQHQYLRESGLSHGLKSWVARWFLHKIRIWDYRTAAGVDQFIANSDFVRRRIMKVYRRESTVIYPPVNVAEFEFSPEKDGNYLAASRLVPYKRMDLIVRAFSQMPDKKLVLIGDGPEFSKLRAIATPNVTLLGFQPSAALKLHMQKARAFIFAGEEDFGITCVEAQACGTPIIAFGKGGSLETVLGPSHGAAATGLFFYQQTPAAIIEAINRFESSPSPISSQACRRHAERFSSDTFRREFLDLVQSRWNEFVTGASRESGC